MSDEEVSGAAGAAIATQVTAFYESHPYPPPVDDLASVVATCHASAESIVLGLTEGLDDLGR